jgi:transcriptional regulator with XRE-family HTH domain
MSPEAAPRPDYPQMGERLRAARARRGLSLRELAGRLGVSPSLISQIETGRANPSVSTLYAIAGELDVSLDELMFNDRRVAPPVGSQPVPAAADELLQRARTRKRIRLASGVEWERLTPLSEPDTEFLYVTYEVGGASSGETAYQRHSGHEWGYVLEGRLDVRIGFDDYILEPGDAISFDSTIPHRLANAGDTPVHAIWFVLGRAPAADADTADAEAGGEDDLHGAAPMRPENRPSRPRGPAGRARGKSHVTRPSG